MVSAPGCGAGRSLSAASMVTVAEAGRAQLGGAGARIVVERRHPPLQDGGDLTGPPANSLHSASREAPMLRWALVFLVLALIAAALGFGGLAATSAGIAKLLFWVFIIIFAISLIAGVATGKRPPVV